MTFWKRDSTRDNPDLRTALIAHGVGTLLHMASRPQAKCHGGTWHGVQSWCARTASGELLPREGRVQTVIEIDGSSFTLFP